MSRLGIIRINGMRFWGKHGISSGERGRAQPIDLDVELAVDCERAVVSDDLDDTVDYSRVHAVCQRIVTQRSFRLLEALAGACLQAVLEDVHVAHAKVRVRKSSILDGATPEVELKRSNTCAPQ